MKKAKLIATCSLTAFLLPAAAMAQDAVPQTDQTVSEEAGITDIVVTAQRRSESVQKASISIAVLSADDIAKAGITQARDISASMPGVQIGQGGAATQIYIRGVGDFGSTATTNPAVAFNIDGVYVARPAGVEGNFFDIERVEVLKGPQGTLYGRNATGGAINVITRKPEIGVREMSGAIEVGNYGKIQAEAAVNIPMGEFAALRVAGQVVNRDGYSNFKYNDDVHQSIRAQLLIKPTDRLSIRFAADYTTIGGGGTDYVSLTDVPGTSPWTSVVDPRVTDVYLGIAAASGLCAPANFPGAPTSPGNLSTFVGACQPLVVPGGPFAGTYEQRSLVRPDTGHLAKTNNEFYNLSAQLDYDFGLATLTIIPAYRHAKLDYFVHPGLALYDASLDGVPETSEATSLEARLSHESDRFKATVGAYYFEESQFSVASAGYGLVNAISPAQDFSTKSYAFFGQATLGITDTFRVIGGLRYTSDKREGLFSVSLLGPGAVTADGSIGYFAALAAGCTPVVVPGAVTTTGCVASSTSGSVTTTKVNWKAGVEFDVGPRSMLYATASTGLKAGGLSSAQSAPGVQQSYAPENLLAFEVGSRNRFLGNKLQVNLEAFYYDYKNHQEPYVGLDGAGNVVQQIVNAGKGRSYGGSIDVVYMPTTNDRFHVGAEYLNTKYTEFVFQSRYITTPFIQANGTGCDLTTDDINKVQTVDCSGRPFTRAPKWTGVVSYAHTFDLANGSDIELEGNMQFQSGRVLGTEYLPDMYVGANQTYNAIVTYSAASKNWSLSAFIRNITDEAVYTSATRSAFAQSFLVASINPPRTYGARLNFNF